jgi:hypothetical protein
MSIAPVTYSKSPGAVPEYSHIIAARSSEWRPHWEEEGA